MAARARHGRFVVARYPDMRRLYGAALLKTQLAGVALPLGCYWPGRSTWLIHERLTMLSLASPGRGRRVAGAGVVGVLVLGAAFSAWASHPRPTIYVAAEVPQPQTRASPAVNGGSRGLSIDLVRGSQARWLVQNQGPLAQPQKPRVAKPAPQGPQAPGQARSGQALECPILPTGSPPVQAVIEAVKCRLDNPTPGRSVKTIDLENVGRPVVLLDEGVNGPDLAQRAYMTQPGETAVRDFLNGYRRDPETGFLAAAAN